jgi:hypothetical protein
MWGEASSATIQTMFGRSSGFDANSPPSREGEHTTQKAMNVVAGNRSMMASKKETRTGAS